MKNLNNERGVTLVLEILLVAVVLVYIALAIYTSQKASTKNAGNQAPPTASPSPSALATPSKIIMDEPTFKMTLPAGWKSASYNEGFRIGDGAVKYYYEDSNGNFFDVFVDPAGSDFSTDEVWELKKTTHGFNFLSTDGMCSPGPGGFCAAGDGKLKITLVSRKNGQADATLNGHDYYFQAGNMTKEDGVDREIFKSILASFTAR